MKPELDRRQFMAGLLALAFALSPGAAFAKDGESGGGSGGGGSGGGGSGSGGKSDDSDSDDSDDSHDSGKDDKDNKDDDRDDDKSDSSKRKQQKDQERAFRAVKDGDVVSLQKLRAHLRAKYPGKVLHVDLKRQMGRYVYRIKLLEKGNRVKSITLDGKTLQSKLF